MSMRVLLLFASMFAVSALREYSVTYFIKHQPVLYNELERHFWRVSSPDSVEWGKRI